MYSEADTRANFIDPALNAAGWKTGNIRREFYFTDGRKLGNNQRGSRCFVDYLLYSRSRWLAIIEAKKASEHPTEGLQQAIRYARILKIRFVYSSNGKQTYEFDLEKGKGNYIDVFPSPEELEQRYVNYFTPTGLQLRNIPFYLEGNIRPRYYQELAVHAVTDAIGENRNRILLTLATGTGKTFIAFQIAHKLFQSRWNRNAIGTRRPRILFLADRNILADQAINTFNPYEKDLLKINGDEIRKRNGKVPTNAHFFFAIYQAIAEKENIAGYYKAYPADFFDLVIIDECHRGSANTEGSWHDILEYFHNAVHLGMTATPKRDDNIDTYNYFGKPAFEYALKDGINDGFLTPYRLKIVKTSIDELELGEGDEILEGESAEKKFTVVDYDRKIIAEQRTELIAKTILENINPFDKTIVFCENQRHALTMRDMINRHKSVSDPEYCVRITSDEGQNGRDMLEHFQDNDRSIPAIVTSSQMLTTGVDARNVRNIVLDRNIQSLVEFKQIIGRGTRLYEGKDYFTIIDFRHAYMRFQDPDWDGPPDTEPDIVNPVKPDDGVQDSGRKPQPIPRPESGTGENMPEPIQKLVVRLGKDRDICITAMETRLADENGKPVGIQEFIDRLQKTLPGLIHSYDSFRQIWSNPESRDIFFDQLKQHGYGKAQLSMLQKLFNAEACDLFDVLSWLAYERPMKTRHDRAQNVRDNPLFFAKFPDLKAENFLHFVLNRYEESGISELSRDQLPALIDLSPIGTTADAVNAFGGNPVHLWNAVSELQFHLYDSL